MSLHSFCCFLVPLDLHFCEGLFSCGEQGLLIVVASLAAEPRLWGTRASVLAPQRLHSCNFQTLVHGISSCGAQS